MQNGFQKNYKLHFILLQTNTKLSYWPIMIQISNTCNYQENISVKTPLGIVIKKRFVNQPYKCHT